MKGDFTRVTERNFAKRYTDVLRQQGRVDLDADWNEQVALRDRLARITATDVIGAAGAPETGGGFAVGISADGRDLTLSAGRMYVAGILCELDEAATYTTQPYLPVPEALTEGDTAVGGRTDLVYLDVWKRHVRAVEDPELLDPALNGLDTTTRLQTVWQVRVLKGVGDVACDAVAGFPPAPSGARLTSDAVATPDAADPCAVVVAGGYRGVENRLYRVEIHDPGAVGAATWKWSRDNGAVLFAVEEFIAAPASQLRLRSLGRDAVLTLRQDDWVEVLDDASELALAPGFMARVVNVNPATRVVTLDRDVPAGSFTVVRGARVRRWDQELGVNADGLLATGAGSFDLEDGVQVRFAGGDYRSGDYWSFAARTAGGTVEELTDAPPQGIRHHYAPLAFIRWSDTGDGSFTALMVEDCRATFPPLTGICADDVCFDNGTCELPGATTVQEALDQLCRTRDLRFHNRHLHGWGIVCGLKVVCGPTGDDGVRREVTLRPGYAIDCEGNDVLVEEEVRVDLLERVAELDAASPNTPLLDDRGDGEVCLVLARNGDGPTLQVEPLGPRQSFMQRVLQGTLLMDFYNGCIRRIVEFVRGEFTPDPGEEAMLVGPTQRRFTTFLNLLIQLVNPANGRLVYLSAKEDTILRDFYHRLRALLQSETFCAMFANARPFPRYPFPDETLSTVFGKGFQTRLRLDPAGRRGYTLGACNRIHVYDLEREEMIADLEFPGGEGVRVRDVAFSADGRRLFGIGTLGSDTLFVTVDIERDSYRFRPATVICDVELVTLATVPRRTNVCYAVGRGRGLYEINPDAVQERPTPRYAFNASGHLVIPENGPAYATASAAGAAPDQYDQVLRLALDGNAQAAIPLRDPSGAARTGQDDLAVLRSAQGPNSRLFVVVDPAGRGGSKQLLVYDDNPDAQPVPRPLAAVPLENTGIKLALIPRFLVLAFEDSYRLGLLNLDSNALVTLPNSNALFRHPVQISPRSLAVDVKNQRAYVLNFASNTIGVVPLRYLRPDAQLDLQALAAYRDGVLEAFFDLAGGFLQYLKDCFCDRFLVDCPECDEEDRLYLACASIRGRQVYQVCNFSRRKYVKSFPTVEYWLSVIPVIPMIREAVTQFCCSVLPDFFGRFQSPKGAVENNLAVTENRVKAAQLRQGVNFMQGLNLAAFRRDLGSRLGVAQSLTGDWLGTLGSKPRVSQPARPQMSQVVGQRVEVAQQELQRAGVQVASVEPYDPKRGAANLVEFTRSGGRIPTDRPVKLYEEAGVVKYFSVVPAAEPVAPAPAETTRLREEITRLSGQVAELTQAREALTATRAEVEALRAGIEETRRTTDAALAAREQEIATLRNRAAQMEREVEGLRGLKAEVDRLRRERPGG